MLSINSRRSKQVFRKLLILWKENLAYLAMPKTGSTAVEAALMPYADIHFKNPPHVKHMTVQKFDRFVRRYLESAGLAQLETVAVMREPLDWLGSWYRYRSRAELDGHENSTAKVSFDAFIQAYLRPDDRPPFAEVGVQSKFLSGGGNTVQVDHLFRYEDIDHLTRFLSNRLGKPITLARSNPSPDGALSLSRGTESALRRSCARDFDLYESLSG